MNNASRNNCVQQRFPNCRSRPTFRGSPGLFAARLQKSIFRPHQGERSINPQNVQKASFRLGSTGTLSKFSLFFRMATSVGFEGQNLEIVLGSLRSPCLPPSVGFRQGAHQGSRPPGPQKPSVRHYTIFVIECRNIDYSVRWSRRAWATGFGVAAEKVWETLAYSISAQTPLTWRY